MGWLSELAARAARRVAAHRFEAIAFFGFVVALMGLIRAAELVPWVGETVAAHRLGGLAGALLLAMTMAWLPLMVIDMKRCTRETALRKQVQADLDVRLLAERADLEATTAARAAVRSVLDGGGPQMVYQPIVEMSSGEVVGYEALSRFEDGTNPAEWFARAGRVGLGIELELAAVRRALSDLPRLEAHTYMSVNVSPAALADPRLADQVRRAPAGRVVLELTEHTAVSDYSDARSVMSALRVHGARLAVDDAGAGYASLRHIVDLSPDIIKVDRALVSGVDTDPARRSLFVALVTFAADIGAHLVAEGVETVEEAERLSSWGVCMGQGWHFGRPRPITERAGQEPIPAGAKATRCTSSELSATG